jgi:outer membrane protein assembly factor BamB
MRWFAGFCCLLAVGCGESQVGHGSTPPTGETKPADASLPDLGTRHQGVDWPGFLGPTGDSISSERGIVAPWPREGPRIVWQQVAGVGYGMPSISHGRLFQFDRHRDKARLSCLKSETGEFLWKFEYPSNYQDRFGYDNGPRCCPVIDGDRVYIFGVEGMLHCVRASDGKLIWKVDTPREFGVEQNFFGVGSTPVVSGDLLLVQVGGSRKGPDGQPTPEDPGNGTGVVAFDKLTGKVRYKITDELASYASPVLATIDGRSWAFVFARGGLIGFEPASGKVDFHFKWRSPEYFSVNASNPVVSGDRVLVSETYGPGSALLRVRPGGYQVLWTDAKKGREKSLQCHWNTPIYHNGYVYGSSGRHSQEAELRCVELETGKVMWRERDLERTSLLMVDGHFLCLSEDGLLLLLRVNPQRYEEVSRLRLVNPTTEVPLLKPPCWAAPILSHGLLYVRGRDRLVCMELIPGNR